MLLPGSGGDKDRQRIQVGRARLSYSNEELLALHGGFGSLSSSEIVLFRREWEIAEIEANQTMDLNDDGVRRAAVCVAGYACVERFPPRPGLPRCLSVLGWGNVAGLPLLGDLPDMSHLEVVRALTHCAMLIAPARAVTSFCRSHPAAYADLLELLARELAIQQVRLGREMSQTVVSNLALLLLVLSLRFADPGNPGTVRGAIASRTRLAEFLGISGESVYRALRSLREEGALSTTHDGIEITDRERLKERAEADERLLALFLTPGDVLRRSRTASARRSTPQANRREA